MAINSPSSEEGAEALPAKERMERGLAASAAVTNELPIVPMIETNRALEYLDAIASVPGVDALLIGPSDLSIELVVSLDCACDTYRHAGAGFAIGTAVAARTFHWGVELPADGLAGDRVGDGRHCLPIAR